MAGGFPLCVNGSPIRTSEALYQACRFPHLPNVQKLIIDERSPMTAKMKGKPYRKDSRPDWDQVRVKVMRWCLRVKLAQNWESFSQLLLKTGQRPIVEESRKDGFWGARPTDEQTLVGMNVLGRLLMELREAVKTGGQQAALRVESPDICNFRLFGRPIEAIDAGSVAAAATGAQVESDPPVSRSAKQASLFEEPAVRDAPRPAYMPVEVVRPALADLKPYPVMKNSGVRWLGEVPEHWEVLPNRAVFTEVKERDNPEEQMLSVTIAKGVVPQKALLAESAKKDSSNLDKSAYKLVLPRDIAYNKMRAWQGAVGVSDHRGIVSPAYVVHRPRKDADSRYFHYLLRTPAFAKEAERWSYGITSDMWSLRPEHFKMIYSCLPPLPEQAAIAQFLDHMDRRIRRYIRVKQKLIKLLEGQKQAVIQRAVTRGLDANVRLKPSGVQWLGDMPEHWEVVRLARVIADGPRNGISPPVDERGTIESFSISAIREGKVDVRDGDKKYILGDKASLESGYCLLQGDVLLVRGNGNIRLVGKAAVVEEDMPNRVYPDLLMRVRLTPRCLPEFLVALLNCPVGRDQVETAARTAVGTFKINNQQVRQLCFGLPPATEQQRIVDWLSDELGAVKAASHRAQQEISLLREYRTRLIADIVTGKLDVRERAARLPDGSGETETIDGADTVVDVEDVTADALDAVPEEAEA